MRSASVALPWYRLFKATMFALLACNAAILFIAGTVSAALDASAWLVLLALFELETGYGGRLRGRHTAVVIHAIRVAAAAAVSAAAIGYLYEREWLDALNSSLWIAVVILLEVEVRYPLAVAQHRVGFMAAATALYSGLAALVLVWAWHGQWFDAYDALLWLIAFATIEIDVLQIFRTRGLASESASGSV